MTIENRYKQKHLNTRLHKGLSMSINKKHQAKSPKLFEIENISKKHVLDYNEKFELYLIICEWNLDFCNVVMSVRSITQIFIQSLSGLRTYLIKKLIISKVKDKFSHIQEMNIRLRTDLRNMTYSQ